MPLLHSSSWNTEEFKLFERFFFTINEDDGALQRTVISGHEMLATASLEIIGLSALWDIALNAMKEVSDRAISMLHDLHQNVRVWLSTASAPLYRS